MTADLSRTHWTTQDRARHFIVPDEAELAPGPFALRTATGRERSVDEFAVAPYEVTEEEARDWAKEQLGAVFGELRGQTLDFVAKLRQKTAEMREENRRSWEQAVADAPPEVREAGSQLRDMLKDLGATLRRAARDHGYDPDAPDAADAAPSASASASSDPAQSADSSTTTSAAAADAARSANHASPADLATSATPSASVDAAGSAASGDAAGSTASADAAGSAASADATGSAASGDAGASADAGVSAPTETTPADADRAAGDGTAPADPPAADRPPSILGGAARPRVDAPAIRLRPEP